MKKTLLMAFSVLALFSFILIGPEAPAEHGGSFKVLEHGMGF